MKIADITHDSDISQFLNLSQLEELLSVINSGEISKLKEKVVAPITTEIQSGGLDEYSVNIGGNPIYNEKAVVLARSLEASFNDLNRVYIALISAGRSHLLEEINTYISKLKQKISQLQSSYIDFNKKSLAEEDGVKAREYMLKAYDFYDEKTEYEKKLESANVLLDQVINWSSSPQTQGVSVSEKDITQDIGEDIKPKTGLVEPGYDLLKKFEF